MWDGVFASFVKSKFAVGVEQELDVVVVADGDSVAKESETTAKHTGRREALKLLLSNDGVGNN